MDDKISKMKLIETDLLAFEKSPLFGYRTANKHFPVIGEGSHDASIMFVGEAPGKHEAESGRPFCGAAGRFLSELIESIGLTRDKVYITNIVKDRPPENRDPTLEEIEMYSPFLDRQIEVIQPRVIATLGRFSMAYIMKKFGLEQELQPISKVHGREFVAKMNLTSGGASAPASISIVTLYHPASALYNGGMRGTHKKDFEILKKFL